jgi:hypothetical protein
MDVAPSPVEVLDDDSCDVFETEGVTALKEQGYVVLINREYTTRQFVENARAEFLHTLNTFPEFNPQHGKDYVMGGFGALGNPASFHNPFARKLQEWTMVTLIRELFRDFISELPSPASWKLEKLTDRMMYRLKGKSPKSFGIVMNLPRR